MDITPSAVVFDKGLLNLHIESRFHGDTSDPWRVPVVSMRGNIVPWGYTDSGGVVVAPDDSGKVLRINHENLYADAALDPILQINTALVLVAVHVERLRQENAIDADAVAKLQSDLAEISERLGLIL